MPAGRTLKIGRTPRPGRPPYPDILIDGCDNSVSRIHLEIRPVRDHRVPTVVVGMNQAFSQILEGNYEIIDLSTNGTWRWSDNRWVRLEPKVAYPRTEITPQTLLRLGTEYTTTLWQLFKS